MSHIDRAFARINADDQHDDGADTWQPLRRPLKQLADRLRLERATMIAIAEAAGIPTEAD